MENSALMSDGLINVWRFDAQQGSAEPLVKVSAVPTVWQSDAGRGTSQAPWIDWIDETRLVIATRGGTVLVLSFNQENWTVRLNALTLNTGGPSWP